MNATIIISVANRRRLERAHAWLETRAQSEELAASTKNVAPKSRAPRSPRSPFAAPDDGKGSPAHARTRDGKPNAAARTARPDVVTKTARRMATNVTKSRSC